MEKKTSFKKGIRSMATEGARSRQTVQAERLNILESDVKSIREEIASAVQVIKQQREFLLNSQENQTKANNDTKARVSRLEEMFARFLHKQEASNVDDNPSPQWYTRKPIRNSGSYKWIGRRQ